MDGHTFDRGSRLGAIEHHECGPRHAHHVHVYTYHVSLVEFFEHIKRTRTSMVAGVCPLLYAQNGLQDISIEAIHVLTHDIFSRYRTGTLYVRASLTPSCNSKNTKDINVNQ